MRRTDVVIVGGGQAGLAMSHCLAREGIDHLVIERGSVACRWLRDGNPQARLLTPNWMTRLPGWRYDGDDPDGFMRFDETAAMLRRYAASFAAPVLESTEVESVTQLGGDFLVSTSRGAIRARAVVAATGHCQTPAIPAAARCFPSGVRQLSAGDFAGSASLAAGAVLVVGASASGVQIAHQLALAGREAWLAVGSHTRLPRRHRDRDIMYWLDASGILGDDTTGMHGVARPSLQLSGSLPQQAPDLPLLAGLGVRLVGRLAGIDRGTVRFGANLEADCRAADRRMLRTLDRIEASLDLDPVAAEGGVCPPPPFIAADGPAQLDLAAARIGAVVWATGYSRSYPWLRLPLLEPDGEIRHTGGATAVPGFHVLGINYMRRRKSAFIDGVGDDAQALARLVFEHLGCRIRSVA